MNSKSRLNAQGVNTVRIPHNRRASDNMTDGGTIKVTDAMAALLADFQKLEARLGTTSKDKK